MTNKQRKLVANLGDTVVTVEGTSEQFCSLDLQIKAIKGLIEMLDFKFVEEGDPAASQKVYLTLLDTIGAMLKVDSPAFDGDFKNIEVVRDFLNWIIENKVHEQQGYKELLDQEEEEDFGW